MRQLKIASRANALKRRIYSSLPVEYRVARFLLKHRILTAVDKNSFGVAFYAEFIKAGVTGMPDVDGIPAEELKGKLKKAGPKAAIVLRRMDPSYGRDFNQDIWRTANKYTSMYGLPQDLAEDVLQTAVINLIRGEGKSKISTFAVHQAESYVKNQIAWRFKDLRKKMNQDPSFSMTKDDDDVEKQIDVIDPQALNNFLRILGPRAQKDFARKLRSLDPRNPDRPWSWIEAQLEGLRDSELAAEWGVTPGLVSQWRKKFEPKIRKALGDIINEVQREYEAV